VLLFCELVDLHLHHTGFMADFVLSKYLFIIPAFTH